MNRPLLLDTCAAIWIADPTANSRKAIEAVDRADQLNIPVFVSPITAWEIGQLVSRNRIALTMPPDTWFARLTSMKGTQLAQMPPDVLIASHFLAESHALRDPADRIIAATARHFGYVVLTRDRPLLEYAAQGHLSAVVC